MSVSRSCALDVGRERLVEAAQQRRVGVGVVERPGPATAIAETPRSGTKTATGPRRGGELPRRSAGRARAHSSGVVRISVTVGVVYVQVASPNRCGTVSRGPKLTMSRAPSETTCGSPCPPAASRRSGPAERTPPTSSSASSVVVEVEHAGEGAGAGERLHRLPARARRVEHEHLVAELLERARARRSRRAS